MNEYFIITDVTVVRENARAPFLAGLFYIDENTFTSKLEEAKKFNTPTEAVQSAIKLKQQDPGFKYKVYVLQINGPQINYGEITF